MTTEPKPEKPVKGQELIRGEGGRIIGGSMTSERAAEIGRKGGSVARVSRDSQELAGALKELIVAKEEGPRADALNVLIDRLAHIASQNSAKALQAITQAFDMIGGDSGLKSPDPGERCPLCGELYQPDEVADLAPDAEALLREVIDADHSKEPTQANPNPDKD